MPIYAYKCGSCGHARDVLQKISDAPLADCPACGASSFTKQVTAAGFQLKGSGWYVTDFRNGSGGAAPAADKASDKAPEKAADKPAEKPVDKPADSGSKPDTGSSSSSSKPDAAGGRGASCACH